MFLTQNVSMIANPILKKLHVLGFTQVQRPVDSPQVAGRISQFATNWKAITEDQWILRTVQGFHIPFREEPCQMRLPRPYHYSEEQMKLLREEVASLLGKGAVQVVDPTLSAEGFYSALFLVPKTEGRMRPVINLKALNFWVQPQHFKMEGIHTLREIVAEGEWLAKLDLKDAYFTVPIFRDHQKYLRFAVDKIRYQFTCLPFGLSCAPWAFTKVLKPVVAFLRSLGIRLIIYIDDILVIGKSPDEVRDHVEALIALLEGLGFIVNMEKSVTTPSQQIEFLGLQVDTITMCLSLPGHKIKAIRGEASQLLRPGSLRQCSQVGTIYREAECNIPSSISSPTFLSSPTERPPVSPTEREPELRDATPVVSGISRRDSMVAAAPFYVEWSNLAETSSAVSDSVRCLTDRVGGSVRGSSDWWSLVSRGAEVPHQLLGVDSSNSSSPGLCQGSIRNIDSLTVRQSDSRGLCQSSRWHSVAAASETGEDTLAVGSSARHYAVCPAHSRGEQSSGRCGVQGDSRSPGLEAICGSFPEDQCCLGSPGSRSICHTPLHSTRSVLQLETGSSSGSNQCFSAGLGASEGVRQPSLVPDGESSETGESSTSSSDPGGPSLERSTVVSSSSGDAVGFSSVDPLVQRPFSDDLRVSGHEFSAPAGRMAYLREKFAGQNLSNTARDLLLASWRSKSNKTYDSHFKKWLRWCTSRGSDPISGPVSEVANFLAELHREGYQSSSLNVFRSAVSSVHEKVDGVEIGKHPTITRLLKGAFHERPPLPRYVSTWDVNIVLQYLKGLGPSSDLSLKQLTYKLVMLLALTRPSRSADLSSLSLARRRFSPEGVTFLPATLAKQSRQGKPLVEFFFPSFSHDEGLCPVQTLRQYESVTFPLRLGVQQELFLAIVKPHKPVSSCTIARWLKCVLNDAGIDVNMFTAHSVRGASSSAAAMAGVTTNDILKAADWSTDSVFRRFYYRPVHSSSFGDAVLSSGCS